MGGPVGAGQFRSTERAPRKGGRLRGGFRRRRAPAERLRGRQAGAVGDRRRHPHRRGIWRAPPRTAALGSTLAGRRRHHRRVDLAAGPAPDPADGASCQCRAHLRRRRPGPPRAAVRPGRDRFAGRHVQHHGRGAAAANGRPTGGAAARARGRRAGACGTAPPALRIHRHRRPRTAYTGGRGQELRRITAAGRRGPSGHSAPPGAAPTRRRLRAAGPAGALAARCLAHPGRPAGGAPHPRRSRRAGVARRRRLLSLHAHPRGPPGSHPGP